MYDGDTFDVAIDVGFDITINTRVRLNKVDTPEMKSRLKEERDLAKLARDFVRDKILNKTVDIITHKKGKYGRYLVDVIVDDNDLASMLLEKKLAKPYFGGKKTPWF